MKNIKDALYGAVIGIMYGVVTGITLSIIAITMFSLLDNYELKLYRGDMDGGYRI